MARLNFTLITREPCWVLTNDGIQKAMFHCWEHRSQAVSPSILRGGHPGGFVADVCAIVEFEDGHVERISPINIQFIDGKKNFKEYDWGEERKKNE